MKTVNEMNTRTTKGYYGWSSKSEVALPNGKAIRFVTMKRSSGDLVTSAQVGTVDDYSFTTIMFQDFSKNIIKTKPARVTAKVVEAQHAMIDVDMVLAQVNAFYK